MTDSWRMAITATRHCLTGCAIGEVTGMVLSTWWGWGNAANIALSIALAFLFGYLLTYTGVRRMGADNRTAVRAALASDTVSILTMEVVDTVFLLLVPGRDGGHARHAAVLVVARGRRWPSRSSRRCRSTTG